MCACRNIEGIVDEKQDHCIPCMNVGIYLYSVCLRMPSHPGRKRKGVTTNHKPHTSSCTEGRIVRRKSTASVCLLFKYALANMFTHSSSFRPRTVGRSPSGRSTESASCDSTKSLLLLRTVKENKTTPHYCRH